MNKSQCNIFCIGEATCHKAWREKCNYVKACPSLSHRRQDRTEQKKMSIIFKIESIISFSFINNFS